jgi:uncharacterized protein (DUF849 family)
MPLNMNRDVFITCAVTGSGDTAGKSRHVPRSPKEIAESAIEAAKAGAAIVHCHVRDPETGAPSRRNDLYKEVTDRIRQSDTDVVLNLTAGMGGDLIFGNVESPLPLNPVGTDMAGATERVSHVAECLPEICTLDCGTMNFSLGDYVMTNTPSMLRAMAKKMTDLGVRPEIEAFDTGHLWFAKQLVEEGLIEDPVLVQLCMGVPWGAPDDLNTYMRWSTTCPPTGPIPPSRSAATPWPIRHSPSSAAAMSASASRIISMSARASSPPMRSWWKRRSRLSKAWVPGSSVRQKCARS